MIIYFSATGNNKYAAQRIADKTGDRIISITDKMKNKDYKLQLEADENIGFITPTYFWGLPDIVKDFLSKMQISNNGKNYVYHVLTYGTTTGTAGKLMEKLLNQKGIMLDASFAVKMVDTWTPMFDLSDKNKNMETTKAADALIDAVISKVKSKQKGDFNKSKGFSLVAAMVQKEYDTKRQTKNFTLLDNCTGCGICEKQCPVGAIKVTDGKAKWIKEECQLCLGCLHKCPQFAIQYGKNTQKHGQFVNPNIKL